MSPLDKVGKREIISDGERQAGKDELRVENGYEPLVGGGPHTKLSGGYHQIQWGKGNFKRVEGGSVQLQVWGLLQENNATQGIQGRKERRVLRFSRLSPHKVGGESGMNKRGG